MAAMENLSVFGQVYHKCYRQRPDDATNHQNIVLSKIRRSKNRVAKIRNASQKSFLSKPFVMQIGQSIGKTILQHHVLWDKN